MDVTFWIVLGLFVFALIMLAAVLLRLLSRLRPLHHAAQQLNARAEKATVLAEQLQQLEATIAVTQQNAAGRKAT